MGDAPVFICDVESEEAIANLRQSVSERWPRIHGVVHSIAFAEYEDGVKPFHETSKREFLRAIDISCFSLMAISRAFQDLLEEDGSVVTLSK